MILSKRLALTWVTLILLLTTLLGARGLNGQTYWYDEWYSIYDAGGIYNAQFSPAQTFLKDAQQDPFHPPGFFLLLATWGGLVGWSEPAARALSWLSGILAVAAVYRLGVALMSRKAGLYAALALGLSAFFLIYLDQVRMYSLVPFECAFGLWLYWRILQAKPTPANLAGLFFVLVAMLYTHYVAGLLAVSIGLYHLIAAPKNRYWLVLLFTIIGAGLTFLPWAGVAYSAALVAGADPARLAFNFTPLELTSDLLYLFSNGSIALLALLAWCGAEPRRAAVRLLWIVGAATLVLTILANSRFHFVDNVRHVMALFPLLALLVGIGAARFKLAPMAMGIWVAAGIWLTFNPAYFQSDWITVLPWDQLARDLRPVAQPGDKLIFLNPDGTPAWINQPVADYYLHDVPVQPYLLESLPDKTPDEYDRQLHTFVGTSPLFWIAFDPQHRHSVSAENAVQRLVNGNYLACDPAERVADLTLQLYATASNVPLNFHFGTGIALGEIQPLPSESASQLRLLLRSSLDPAVNRSDYSVALHVENAAGQLVAQTDFGLFDGCYVAEIANLSPGTDHALLIVYRWQTGERLSGTNAATGEQADQLPLGQFTVTG
ncbi:MAG TPA: glycosyltransferase family 39 protein [Phototrophicaceae bacterium]|nr:glycosyltransferase family 39 protein [Phototrophicaceae bacterium]